MFSVPESSPQVAAECAWLSRSVSQEQANYSPSLVIPMLLIKWASSEWASSCHNQTPLLGSSVPYWMKAKYCHGFPQIVTQNPTLTQKSAPWDYSTEAFQQLLFKNCQYYTLPLSVCPNPQQYSDRLCFVCKAFCIQTAIVGVKGDIQYALWNSLCGSCWDLYMDSYSSSYSRVGTLLWHYIF